MWMPDTSINCESHRLISSDTFFSSKNHIRVSKGIWCLFWIHLIYKFFVFRIKIHKYSKTSKKKKKKKTTTNVVTSLTLRKDISAMAIFDHHCSLLKTSCNTCLQRCFQKSLKEAELERKNKILFQS